MNDPHELSEKFEAAFREQFQRLIDFDAIEQLSAPVAAYFKSCAEWDQFNEGLENGVTIQRNEGCSLTVNIDIRDPYSMGDTALLNTREVDLSAIISSFLNGYGSEGREIWRKFIDEVEGKLLD